MAESDVGEGPWSPITWVATQPQRRPSTPIAPFRGNPLDMSEAVHIVVQWHMPTGGGWGLSRDGGSAGREQGDGYAYGVDDIESGSSASESGDSYISASSGTASNARWRAWPAAGSFTSIVSARQRVSSTDPAKQRPPAARPKPPT